MRDNDWFFDKFEHDIDEKPRRTIAKWWAVGLFLNLIGLGLAVAVVVGVLKMLGVM